MAKSDAPKVPKEKKEKTPRAPSPYNKFMKDEIARVKKAQPGLDHKEAFKAAAANVSPFFLFFFTSWASFPRETCPLCKSTLT